MNYQSLKNIFGEEAAEKLRALAKNMDSLDWSTKQSLTLCEGYPNDTNTNEFSHADSLNNDGWTCHTLGQYEEALDYYHKALELCSDFPMVWNNKGLSHFRLGQFDKAREAYEKAIEINPLFIKPFSNMGILYYELKGDNKKAKNWLVKALTLDPNYQRAKGYLKKIQDEEEHADVLLIGTDPEYAEGLIKAFQNRGKTVKWFR